MLFGREEGIERDGGRQRPGQVVVVVVVERDGLHVVDGGSLSVSHGRIPSRLCVGHVRLIKETELH